MSGKMETHKVQEPHTLTASDIRMKVEEIAETLAKKIGPAGSAEDRTGVEVVPVNTRQFVILMSEFIRMN